MLIIGGNLRELNRSLTFLQLELGPIEVNLPINMIIKCLEPWLIQSYLVELMLWIHAHSIGLENHKKLSMQPLIILFKKEDILDKNFLYPPNVAISPMTSIVI